MKKTHIGMMLISSLITLASCGSDNGDPSTNVDLPSIRDLINEITENKNYTLAVESSITGLVYNSSKRFTKNECYFESPYSTDNFGYKNSENGFYKYRIRNEAFKPSYSINENYTDYHKLVKEISSLSYSSFPIATFKGRANTYDVTDRKARNQFALLSDLVSEDELDTFLPSALEIHVTSKTSFYGDLTFATQGTILGKIRYTVTDIGSTSIALADSYTGDALPFDGKIERIRTLFGGHNFESKTYDDSNVLVSNNYFVENAIYQDFSDIYEAKTDETYIDEGIVQISGKTTLSDGFYHFTNKDNDTKIAEKYNISSSISSLYDLTITPGFLGMKEVLKEFDGEYKGLESYYDFFSDNSAVLELTGELTGIYTQAEYQFYVIGAGLVLEEATSDEDCSITLRTFFTYQNSYSYSDITYTNFGGVKLTFLENFLSTIQ